ncbi:oxidoreductase NAD-binding protein [Calocera viscosa TUFC12733]|uniref:Oxidoreductase NAD-binding protein n=1 Tax=Calocera viscosa (strain TUFC12733) TaxID=1330018 RepID=A0A167MHC5_CALVF|nr:oxidoreductase NAD-binding protein [Calocera viscosa TUFC12733]
MAPIRAAVLGVGFSADVFHIPFIVAQPELYKLHSIMERRATATASKARDKYGHLGVKVVTTLEEVISDPEVDLVVVTVKDAAHFPYAKAALSAGKHVVLEKPVTATSAEVRELIAIAKAKKVVFAPYHNRRFDGDFLTLRSLIDAGKLPDLVDFESRYDTRADWGLGAPGGSAGILYGLGSHIIDQAVALFGEPKTVTAFLLNGRREGHPDVDDSFILHLRYANNPVVVTLRSALHSVASHQIRFIVRSKNSSFVKYGLDTQEPQAMFQGMGPLDPGFGAEPESSWGEYGVHDADGKDVFEKVKTIPGTYLGYYKNVAGAINGTGTLEVTPEHAELGMRIIEAAKVSDKEQKTVEFASLKF